MARKPVFLGIVALSLIALFVTVALAWSPEAPSLPPDRAQVRAALQGAPLLFIQNVGQFDPRARFQVRGGLGGGTVWLAEEALWVTVVQPPTPAPSPTQGGGEAPLSPRGSGAGGEGEARRGVHLKLRFLGANPQPRLEPFNRLETHVSYFLGNDPAKWRADVPVWGGVRAVGLYPGVDLEVSGEGGRWAWRLLAGSGADLGQVRLVVEGAEGVTLEGERVRLDTALGAFALPPLLGAEGALLQPSVTAGRIAFAPQPADPFPLFPESVGRPADDLLYSTFLGGGNSDRGIAIAVDGAGAAYVTGYTSSSDFPTTPGAFDPSYNGGYWGDAFVTKLNASGSGLVYSTFLGGGNSDWGYAIALDGSGAAYVMGRTLSTNFPTTPGAFDPSYNGNEDAFVTKLNASGTGLVYSTFLGGSADDCPSHSVGCSIAVDGSGAAYVTGQTESSNFPTTPGAFDPTFNGLGDAFVTKLNASGTGLVYSTFLSGQYGRDGGEAITVDGAGAAYVTGWTYSSDFPITPGAFDPTLNGAKDAFVTKLNASGSGLVYSTFLGGSDNSHYGEWGLDIVVDGAGAAYVTGSTDSYDFPTTSGAFDPTFNGGIFDAFVIKLNASGSGLLYSTFLGGSGDECSPHFKLSCGIAVDGTGAAYIAGTTNSLNFPTTPGAFDPSYNGDRDAFVTKLNASGSGLVYSTFLGGGGDDWGRGIALDGSGAAYVMGGTLSTDFPTTPGAFDPTCNSCPNHYDAFVSKLRLEAATPTPTPTRTPGVSLVKLNVPYGTVQPGERISYTIHYSNVGGVPLSGIVITDAIPVNTVLDPASLQPPATVQAGVIRWQPLPTVLPGGSERVAFAVVLPTPTPGLRPGVVGEGAAPPAPVGAQGPLQGCPPGVQVCNVAWIYTTQTNRWQASNPAFNPSTRLYLPLVLKGP